MNLFRPTPRGIPLGEAAAYFVGLKKLAGFATEPDDVDYALLEAGPPEGSVKEAADKSDADQVETGRQRAIANASAGFTADSLNRGERLGDLFGRIIGGGLGVHAGNPGGSGPASMAVRLGAGAVGQHVGSRVGKAVGQELDGYTFRQKQWKEVPPEKTASCAADEIERLSKAERLGHASDFQPFGKVPAQPQGHLVPGRLREESRTDEQGNSVPVPGPYAGLQLGAESVTEPVFNALSSNGNSPVPGVPEADLAKRFKQAALQVGLPVKSAAGLGDLLALGGGAQLGYSKGNVIAGDVAAGLAPKGRVTRSENVAESISPFTSSAGILGGLIAHHKYRPDDAILQYLAKAHPQGLLGSPAVEQAIIRAGTPAIAAALGGMAGGAATGATVGGIQRLRGPLNRKPPQQALEEDVRGEPMPKEAAPTDVYAVHGLKDLSPEEQENLARTMGEHAFGEAKHRNMMRGGMLGAVPGMITAGYAPGLGAGLAAGGALLGGYAGRKLTKQPEIALIDHDPSSAFKQAAQEMGLLPSPEEEVEMASAQAENELAFYRERFQQSAQEMGLLQQQTEQLQSQVDEMTQTQQAAMDQATMVQQQSMQNAQAAHEAASNAMQQTMQAQQEALANKQESMQVRDHLQGVKQTLVDVASQIPDIAGLPTMPTPGATGAPMDPNAAAQPAPEQQSQIAPLPNPPEPPPQEQPQGGGQSGEGGAPPLGEGGKAEGGDGGKLSIKVGNARLLGALGGAAVGGVGTALESRMPLDGLRGKVQQLEERERGGGSTFLDAVNLAQSKFRLGLREAAQSHPVAATAAGAVLGASAGMRAAPAVQTLME